MAWIELANGLEIPYPEEKGNRMSISTIFGGGPAEMAFS